MTPSPVATAMLLPAPRSRAASAQRAAWTAWSVAARAPASVTTSVPSSRFSWRASCCRARSASAWLRRDSSTPGRVAASPGERMTTTDTSRCSAWVRPSPSTVAASAPIGMRSSSRTTAWPSGGRSLRALASMRVTRRSSASGTPWRAARRRGVSSRMILSWTASASAPRNGERPVRQRNITQPSEKTSARASMSRSPRACSGAMKPGVPTAMPVRVNSLRAWCERAMPKSIRVTRSIAPPRRKRFDGLTSRWTMPRSCRRPRMPATRRASSAVCPTDKVPASSRRESGSPSSHSVTR